MNSTSCGSRLVSSAARSPARSSTGPDVWRRLTPSSCAMMCDSVVLPSPGGPNSSTWSSDSFRCFAASMKIASWLRIFSCPTYSASARGRSARSTVASSPAATFPATSRSTSSLSIAIRQLALRLREQFQRLPDPVADRESIRQFLDHRERLLVRISERDERMQHVGRHGRRPMHANGSRDVGTELVLELEQDAFGGLLADAGDLRQAPRVLHRDGLGELGDRETGQHRERGARADAADLEQLAERAAFALAAEAEQQVCVLAHDQVR